MDLSNYVLVGRYDLPEPTRTAHPAGSLLAQEVSAITYDWSTDTLFVVGDGGTSVVQVSKTGTLIDSMTLAAGGSPQGTEFYDTEGLTYIGSGQFVMTEERDRNAVKFTYAAGTTLTRAAAETVNLGSNVGNIGLEGVTYDPLSGGYLFVKEKDPEQIFQTTIDFALHTASNPSVTDLFPAAGLGLIDFADVYALSGNPTLAGGPDGSHVLILSQESGKIVEVDRLGNVISTLTIYYDPGTGLDVATQQHEGLTMDAAGNLYVVSENGGGDFDHPQMWVFAPAGFANAAPTGIALYNAVTSVIENTDTSARIKVADVGISDDGIGNNILSVGGTDAAFFEVDNTGLFIKAGTILDYETKTSYSITVSVDDPGLGATPDASTPFTLDVSDVLVENGPPALYISEVAPWSSGNSPVGADWFEVTNGGVSPLDITGWRMDDSSAAFGSSVALNGVTSIASGESVIFIESSASNPPATAIANFISTWFGGSAPAGLQIGTYQGSGVGLSTGGDGVTLFDSAGELKAKVSFGVSPNGPFPTFNNAEGLDNATLTTLSEDGVNGAFAAVGDAAEIGSPGTVGRIIISEVAPWSSGNSPVGADWFEVSNTSAFAVDLSGWKMDDSSGSFAASVALNGISVIDPGESVIFIEASPATSDAKIASFVDTWFGGIAPANLQIGTYSGSGVGLSTGGDAVNLYNAAGALQASVTFGASPSGPYPTFDNTVGLNDTVISALSVVGAHGAFTALADAAETGSPGRNYNSAPVFTSPATFDVDENSLHAATIAAGDNEGDSIAFSISGGADQGSFTIDPVSGEISFAASPDFETPEDADADNVYELEVSAVDSFGYASTRSITIEVNNVTEPGFFFSGGNRGNSLFGSTGDDDISGGNGNDTLSGNDGNDTLAGGNGKDVLLGGRGDDMLDGGNGDDRLIGGPGDDCLIGGRGDDWFVFDNVTESGNDTVKDMANGDLALFSQPLAQGDLQLSDGMLALAGGGSVDFVGVASLNYSGMISYEGSIYSAYSVASFA